MSISTIGIKQNKINFPSPPQVFSALAAMGVSLIVSNGVSVLAQKVMPIPKHHNQINNNSKNQFSIADNWKEPSINFIQSFLAILSALFVSRAFSKGAFKLNSWKNAFGAINLKSLMLAAGVSSFNVLIEICADMAQKAKPHLESLIRFMSLTAKVLGSLSLVKLIGGLNPDATLGSVAGACPCCGSPFIICLTDLIAIIQSISKPINTWFNKLKSKIKPPTP